MAPPSQFTVDAVRAQVAEVLDEPVEQVGEHDNLLDRGVDSIRLMSLVERFREQGVEISFVDLAETPTVAGWATLLSGLVEQAAR